MEPADASITLEGEPFFFGLFCKKILFWAKINYRAGFLRMPIALRLSQSRFSEEGLKVAPDMWDVPGKMGRKSNFSKLFSGFKIAGDLLFLVECV